MNIGCLPEINVQLWHLRTSCSRLELRGWEWCLMDALNSQCCPNQPSCSPLPPQPLLSFLGHLFGISQPKGPAQKAEGLWGNPLITFPAQLHEACAIPGGSSEEPGAGKSKSHPPMVLQSWLNCLKAAISHWINTA